MEHEDGKEITLEDRVKTLEYKLETIWREIFSAYHSEVAKGGDGRSTLKGVVDRICKQTGVEPVVSPWSIVPKPEREMPQDEREQGEINAKPCNIHIEYEGVLYAGRVFPVRKV